MSREPVRVFRVLSKALGEIISGIQYKLKKTRRVRILLERLQKMSNNTISQFFANMSSLIIENLNESSKLNQQFDHFARWASRITGRSMAFYVAIIIIAVWIISGPIFGFSDTWQLIINTATTIVTFLMVFLIQHTQNREAEAVQVKLDELIRAIDGAHNALLDLEELEEEELGIFHKRYSTLAQLARQELVNGTPDTGTPDVEK